MLKKVHMQDRVRKPQEPYPNYGMMLAPSLASNAMHLHP